MYCKSLGVITKHAVTADASAWHHIDSGVSAGEFWTSADIVDCILSYAVTQLMSVMTDENSRDGADMLSRVCIPV